MYMLGMYSGCWWPTSIRCQGISNQHEGVRMVGVYQECPNEAATIGPIPCQSLYTHGAAYIL